MATMHEEMKDKMMGTEEYAESDEVYLYDPADTTFLHQNKLTDDYLAYLNKIDPEICQSIGYTRTVGMNLVRKVDGKARSVTIGSTGDSRAAAREAACRG